MDNQYDAGAPPLSYEDEQALRRYQLEQFRANRLARIQAEKLKSQREAQSIFAVPKSVPHEPVLTMIHPSLETEAQPAAPDPRPSQTRPPSRPGTGRVLATSSSSRRAQSAKSDSGSTQMAVDSPDVESLSTAAGPPVSSRTHGPASEPSMPRPGASIRAPSNPMTMPRSTRAPNRPEAVSRASREPSKRPAHQKDAPKPVASAQGFQQRGAVPQNDRPNTARKPQSQTTEPSIAVSTQKKVLSASSLRAELSSSRLFRKVFVDDALSALPSGSAPATVESGNMPPRPDLAPPPFSLSNPICYERPRTPPHLSITNTRCTQTSPTSRSLWESESDLVPHQIEDCVCAAEVSEDGRYIHQATSTRDRLASTSAPSTSAPSHQCTVAADHRDAQTDSEFFKAQMRAFPIGTYMLSRPLHCQVLHHDSSKVVGEYRLDVPPLDLFDPLDAIAAAEAGNVRVARLIFQVLALTSSNQSTVYFFNGGRDHRVTSAGQSIGQKEGIWTLWALYEEIWGHDEIALMVFTEAEKRIRDDEERAKLSQKLNEFLVRLSEREQEKTPGIHSSISSMSNWLEAEYERIKPEPETAADDTPESDPDPFDDESYYQDQLGQAQLHDRDGHASSHSLPQQKTGAGIFQRSTDAKAMGDSFVLVSDDLDLDTNRRARPVRRSGRFTAPVTDSDSEPEIQSAAHRNFGTAAALDRTAAGGPQTGHTAGLAPPRVRSNKEPVSAIVKTLRRLSVADDSLSIEEPHEDDLDGFVKIEQSGQTKSTTGQAATGTPRKKQLGVKFGADDGQGSSITILTPVKAKKQQREELGVEEVLTPVRRSRRLFCEADYVASVMDLDATPTTAGQIKREDAAVKQEYDDGRHHGPGRLHDGIGKGNVANDDSDGDGDDNEGEDDDDDIIVISASKRTGSVADARDVATMLKEHGYAFAPNDALAPASRKHR